jgi:hypothetical protein
MVFGFQPALDFPRRPQRRDLSMTSLLFGLGCLFFVIGHSTLLYFKSRGISSLPIRQALLPWPKQGRIVSLLCLALSIGWLLLAIASLPSEPVLPSGSSLKILVVFAVAPCAVYLIYFFRRIKRGPDGLSFCVSDPGRAEWSLPIVLGAAVSLVYWFFK